MRNTLAKQSKRPECLISSSGDSWLTLVGWGIVVTGWLANHWLSEIRDRRKEVRGQLDAVLNAIETLRGEAIDFHLNEQYQRPEADALRMAIRKIEGANLRLNLIEERSVAVHVKRIRQSITLKNFEPSDFKAQPYSGEIITEIQLEIEDLAATLESAYSRKYPNHFPYYSRK